MKGLHVVFIVSQLTAVLAGGYHGCLERVLLYNAYQIDALNDPNDQTIGFRCRNPNKPARTCPRWEACTPPANSGRTRCNFDELVFSLGKAPARTGWSIYDQNGKLAAEQSAKQCFKLYTKGGGPNDKVKDYPAYNAVRDSWEFNDYIKRVGDTVNRTRKKQENVLSPEKQVLFDSFDETMDLVTKARTGDHGKYLVPKAEASLGGKMKIITQDLGSNPANGDKWETVDWKETAKQAKAQGVPNVDRDIQAFLANWYTNDRQAKDHRVVAISYKRLKDRCQSCR